MLAAADITARIVASHRSIGQVSRRRMMPRELPPDFIEVEYATRLIAEVQQWRDALAPLLADLPSLLASARQDSFWPGHGAQGDPATGFGDVLHETAQPEPFRLDNDNRRARGLIEHGRLVVRQSATDVQTIAPRLARRVVDHQRTQLGRQLKASLGVDVPTPDRKVPTQIEHFVSQNVAKIRSLGDRTLDDIERIIGDAFTSQMPIDDVGALIAKRFSVAESYARRLAADQITKLDAQVRQARHLELGIAMFQWKTMADGHVRDSHEVKHNKVFPYRGSRAPSFFPGEEHGCRCRAVPIVDEIRIKAGIPIGRGRQRIV